MAITRTQIYRTLWESCEHLRGAMEAIYYKNYVLSLLFVKYVSDKYEGQGDAPIVIPANGGFAEMVRCVNNPKIGALLDEVINTFLSANNLSGYITIPSFNDPEKFGKGNDMVVRLSKLVSAFNVPELDFSHNRADGDDLLGDAYEFLMRQFAFEAGKSKGQFYTPSEVSLVMAKLLQVQDVDNPTIYDPTCGSGALLLKAFHEAQTEARIFGQEMDGITASLARMNMILHGCANAEIATGNTLAEPAFLDADEQLQTFDFVVANPPFSLASWMNGVDVGTDPFGRFGFGIPPTKNGDYAFLLHILASLNEGGKGAVILPHGVLFRGGAEGIIRKQLIERGFITAVIGLPANLFYGTGIPACLILLSKRNNADGIFMVDASRGFAQFRTQNRLRYSDIHRIVETVTHRQHADKYARMVSFDEIRTNDFNLNIPRYIDTSEPEDVQDVQAHLLGGIPNRDIDALTIYWDALPSLKDNLFQPLREGYSAFCVPIEQIRHMVKASPDLKALTSQLAQLFSAWVDDFKAYVRGYQNQSPDAFIAPASEALLHLMDNHALMDGYALYEHFMTYWENAMRDDFYLLKAGAWRGLNDERQPNTDLIPRELVLSKFVLAQSNKVADIQSDLEGVNQEIDELLEAHSSENGLLAESSDPKGKVTLATIRTRYKAIFGAVDYADEVELLEALIRLFERQANLRKSLKAGVESLNVLVERAYAEMTPEDVWGLVVCDKWLSHLSGVVQDEIGAIATRLANQLEKLGKRYEKNLGQLEKEVAQAREKVNKHLRAMGYGGHEE